MRVKSSLPLYLGADYVLLCVSELLKFFGHH